MKEHNFAVSLPTGPIGAMCQSGIEEDPEFFDEMPVSQIDELITLLRELCAEGQITLSAYWEIAEALGR